MRRETKDFMIGALVGAAVLSAGIGLCYLLCRAIAWVGTR